MSDDKNYTKNKMVVADNPIRKPEEDLLGRNTYAQSFARHVLALDVTDGAVVGVLGAWGSGKTSFVNLARAEFEKAGIPVVDFNPWMFSGAEQLIEKFFIEVSAQLKNKKDFAEIAKNLAEYGEIFSDLKWLPVVGPWIERVSETSKALKSFIERRKGGIGGQRQKLTQTLNALHQPIVVVLDDIDRLSSAEIRDIFKVVRLTASFPKVIYILAFDRTRVEQALSDDGVPGRAYLEKILQVAIDIPAIPSQVMHSQILEAIDKSLQGIDKPGVFNQDIWPDLFFEVIRPLIRNMRDVRRYAAAIHGTVSSLGGQIALADVLALEAIRVFLPDVYSKLHNSMAGLTTVFSYGYGIRSESPEFKDAIDKLIEAAGEHSEVVRSMIKHLFLAARRHIGDSSYGEEWKKNWLSERRVAHEHVLTLYLEHVAGEGFKAFAEAEHAFRIMEDLEAFNSYLNSLKIERLEDVIAALETFEDKFTPKHVIPGVIALLNIRPILPERPRGMFGFDTSLVVGRVTYRLIRSLKDPSLVEESVRKILPQVTLLSAKLELINQIGYRKDIGLKLVTEDAASEFEKAWRAEVRATLKENFESEHDLLRVLILARETAEDEPAFELPDDPGFTLTILQSARNEVRSQSMGSRTVHRLPRLEWDSLIKIFGDEGELRERINRLRETMPKDDNEVLKLAEKYLGGWRPKEFDNE
ncbi:MAG: P-loop NTPase fold protein [Meiothermus sp.]|nr:P-loop NTPase fold protein [Meiothermus sp.]